MRGWLKPLARGYFWGFYVISHRHRCVYVHIPKCGGQSIETVFLQAVGLTWKKRAPLLLRPCSDPRFGPQFLAHLTAREYTELGHLSQTDFIDYYRFAVIRNPWDRLLSTFRYRAPAEGVTFPEWVRKAAVPAIERGHFFYKPQVEYLCDADGTLLVEDVFDLADMPKAFDAVRQRLELPGEGLPHVNASKGHRHLTPEDAYDDETVQLVGQLYAADVDKWGFQPPRTGR
jgi:hypothetical protein